MANWKIGSPLSVEAFHGTQSGNFEKFSDKVTSDDLENDDFGDVVQGAHFLPILTKMPRRMRIELGDLERGLF